MTDKIKYDPLTKQYLYKCDKCYGFKWHPLVYIKGKHGVIHMAYKHPEELKTKTKFHTIFVEHIKGLPLPVENSKELQREIEDSKKLKLF